LNLFTAPGGSLTCFAGDMDGDAFPNAELFVQYKGTSTMLHTFTTPGGQETGPLQYLPGKNARPMGTFRKCL
jgi:hypothetical protein